MKVILPTISNIVLLIAAFGLGGLLRPLFPKNFRRIDRLAIIPLGGIGLLGILLFLVGLTRFTPITILAVIAPAALLGVRCIIQESKANNSNFRLASISIIPFSVVALVLAITVLGGLAEPVGDNKLDAISYHFLGPRVWLREGVIRPVLDESRTSFPATVEVQYAALMAFGGQRAPELFSVSALVLIVLLAIATALRSGLDINGSCWVAALICTMPALYRGVYGGLNDVVYAAFVIAAARVAFDAELTKEYALAGLLCGFAIGTKYTGLIATVLILICAPAFSANLWNRFSRSFLKQACVVCLIAFVVGSPWYIRNWILLGCPIYPPPPLLDHLFHASYFPAQAIQQFHKQMLLEGQGIGRGPLSLLMLPINLTFHPANFQNGAGGIGLVGLAFLPFCFRAYRWDPFARRLALLGLLLTVAWFCTMQESRYLIHVYVITAIFGVAGWQYVLRAAPRFGPSISAVTIATSIAYGLFMIVVARKDDIHSAVSTSFAEQRRQAAVPFLESFKYLNGDSLVAKVLILDPTVPPYYLEKAYLKPFGKAWRTIVAWHK